MSGILRAGLVLGIATVLAAGCDSGPSEYCDAPGLQAALAGAHAGETVQVGACTVAGSFDVRAGVTLAGRGVGQTVLQGADPHGAVVRLKPGAVGSATVLTGLRIESSSLAGVHARGAGAIALRDVEVRSNEGAGLAFTDVSSVTLERVSAVGPVPPEGTDRLEGEFQRVAAMAPDRVEPGDPTTCAAVTAPECTPDERRVMGCGTCGAARQFCDPCGLWTSVVATQGLVLGNVAMSTLTDVDVRGFAEHGVVALGDGSPTLSWTRGIIAGNIGFGLYADGVRATLSSVHVQSTFNGFRSVASAAAYFGATGGAGSVETTGLTLDDNRGFGAIHVGAQATHTGLVATGNRNAALWAGDTTRFEVSDAMLSGNRVAGIVLVHASGVAISRSMVAATTLSPLRVGRGEVFGSVMLGDGIQIFDSTTGVSLSNVTLENNARTGLALDMGTAAGSPGEICHAARDGVCFDAVTVRGTGTQHGAIAGNMRAVLLNTSMMPVDGGYTVTPIATGTWDSGITRSIEADDGVFDGSMEMAGTVGPIEAPRPDNVAGTVGPIE